jgi:hypothetical protein
MHIRKYIQSLLCLVLLVTVTPSLATTVTYVMDQSNALTDGVDYLSVTLSDDIDGQLDFWVDSLPVLSDIAGDNYGIQSFAFNYSSLLASDFILSDGWHVQYNKGMSEVGMFDVRIMGAGNSRQDPLHFSVIGLSLDEIVADFAAHVAGFDLSLGDCSLDGNCDDGITSAFFFGNREAVPPAAIPVPAAAWLFSSGLVGLIGVARRRRI